MLNEHKSKDLILNHLINGLQRKGNYADSTELSNQLNLDYEDTVYLIDELGHSGYIRVQDATNAATGPIGLRLATITAKGKSFLKYGGYSKVQAGERRERIWTIVKTVAGTLNAIVVVCIAAWGVYIQAEANKKQERFNDREEIKSYVQLLLPILKEQVSKVDTIKVTPPVPKK
ncbi:MAG: hypothetical protein EOO20_04735 [Chryseobacterium sp.]|nr:MAG: hypothetical protein EOO20_04735 [Chryseobacterium sp.]